ncbi:MAG: hypothetical protein KC643_12655 [Nitrospira sp.]|nr:hypothetical protein [Nitrospira sp.]
MASSLFQIRFFLVILWAGLGLAGCASLSGLFGSFGAETKCREMLPWAQRFEQEFSLQAAWRSGGQGHAVMANLYRHEVFEPVFGFPYEKAQEEKINDIARDVLPYCFGEKPGVEPALAQKLRLLKKLFDEGFPFDDGLSYLVTVRLKNEAWRQQALSEIPDVPATTEGFLLLEHKYLHDGEREVEYLWPSARQAYLTAVHARQASMAAFLVPWTIPDPDRVPASENGLQTLKEVEPYLAALDNSRERSHQDLAGKYHIRKREIVGGLIQERITALQAIPNTQEGFQLSQAWLAEFERRFLAYGDWAEVQQARLMFLNKRDAIFAANRREIYERFASLGVGNPARRKEQQLIAETFPLPSDYQLAFYREFRANYHKTGDSVVLDLLDKSKRAVVDYYKAISGFAKDMLYGRPE